MSLFYFLLFLLNTFLSPATAAPAKDCNDIPSGAPIPFGGTTQQTGVCEFGGEPVCEVVGTILTCALDWTGSYAPPNGEHFTAITMQDEDIRVWGYGGVPSSGPGFFESFCCYIDDEHAASGVTAVVINGDTVKHVTRFTAGVTTIENLKPWKANGTMTATVNGGSDDDQMYGSHYNGGGSLVHYLYGNDGDDLVYGAVNQKNSIYGGTGEDVIYGGNAGDAIYAGDNNDTVHGGSGADLIYGGWGADILFGGDGDDLLFGGPGNDQMHGGKGNDKLTGDAGNDTLYGGFGDDELYGGNNNDVLCETSWSLVPATPGTCPTYNSFVGGSGSDKAWIEDYIINGRQVCENSSLLGNNTVELARDDFWDWSDVLTSTGTEENDSTPYAECASIIALFGR